MPQSMLVDDPLTVLEYKLITRHEEPNRYGGSAGQAIYLLEWPLLAVTGAVAFRIESFPDRPTAYSLHPIGASRDQLTVLKRAYDNATNHGEFRR